MRLTRWTLLWVLVIGVLIALEVGVLTGRLTSGDLIGSFLSFLIILAVISVLSIVGAVFVGMLVSHRLLSTKGFTPFEQEMLRMRQEIRELSERVREIAVRLGASVGNQKKEP